MPKAESLTKMLEDGGQYLTFAIKAHETLTHKIDPSQWEKEAKTYLLAIEPLLEAKRLEAVLFQFPYSFHYTVENRKYLDRLLTFFKGIPVVVEFRAVDWCNAKMIGGMKNRETTLVSVDVPELKGLFPSTDVTTASLAYIRFHGRNKEAWYSNKNHERYTYRYDDNEIDAWAARINRVSEQVQRILIYFNNHPFGHSVKNAQTLERLLINMGLVIEREKPKALRTIPSIEGGLWTEPLLI
jgi:uncharacterized protein YecE (DUF72 family)